jgi:hypothetical protein
MATSCGVGVEYDFINKYKVINVNADHCMQHPKHYLENIVA